MDSNEVIARVPTEKIQTARHRHPNAGPRRRRQDVSARAGLDEDARTVMPTLGFMVRACPRRTAARALMNAHLPQVRGLVMADGTQLKVWDVGGRRDVRRARPVGGRAISIRLVYFVF